MIYKIDNRPNKNKNKYIALGIVLGIVLTIGGVYVYGNYQSAIIQSANLIKDTAVSQIPKISTSQNSPITTQENTLQNEQTSQPSTSSQPQGNNYNNSVPMAVYDNCQSVLRINQNIQTNCIVPNGGVKRFEFNLPPVLEQALPQIEGASTFMGSKVYQYGTNDFKIGLFDQVGEKNYTVTLWQLP